MNDLIPNYRETPKFARAKSHAGKDRRNMRHVTDGDTSRRMPVTDLDISPEAIGDLFKKAHTSAAESVQFAIQCGQRLIAKKSTVKHGHWLFWLKENREVLGFGEDTAQRWIKLATSNTAPARFLEPEAAVTLNRLMWGHAPKAKPAQAAPTVQSAGDDASNGMDDHWEPDEEAGLKKAAKACDAAVDEALSGDAQAVITKLASQVTTLTISRDYYMDAAKGLLDEMRNWKRTAEGLQRHIAGIEGSTKKLQAENEALRERIAIMEGSA